MGFGEPCLATRSMARPTRSVYPLRIYPPCRYYRITAFGKAAARAEARRLAGLVRLARASGLAPRST